ncbi:MAG TPA: hypothetical protein VGH98_08670 [Gemmatimonadaceae bacterium]|jgi:hypothetical protein
MMESVRSGNVVAGTAHPKPMFSIEGVAALHAALGDRIADRDPKSSSRVRDALRYLCREAELKNWPPELLLIAFKKALETVPAVQRLARGPDRDDFVARLVSRCIAEYYADSRPMAAETRRNSLPGNPDLAP